MPDYLRGANEYTNDSVSFLRQNLIQGILPLYLSGFRIELADQSTSPGQLTIYNGHALDRDGLHLNDESQINDSRTITLTGVSTTFYIEIEFTEALSDTDSRAFWDQTFVNTGSLPKGKEFALPVSTRITPSWTVVTPVSTTAFERDSDLNSTKLPLARLVTNGSNEITGVTTVNAAGLLTQDTASGTAALHLTSSLILPDSGSILVDAGGPNQETLTILTNDRVNNVITTTTNLSNNHLAGAIVRETGVSAEYVPERTAAAPTSTSVDQRVRLWSGDEVRGSAFVKSAEVYGDRADLAINSQKDYIDFIASLFREVKFGNIRNDVTSTLPPLTFADTRYYDNAGGILGARAATITIGDGTNSYGDLNGTDLVVLLTTALAATDAGDVIYIKEGSYTSSGTVNITHDVAIIGAPGNFSAISPGVLNVNTASVDLYLQNINTSLAAAAANVSFTLKNCVIDILSMPITGPVSVTADSTTFNGAAGSAAISTASSANTINFCYFNNCTFVGDDSGIWVGSIKDAIFNNCEFSTSSHILTTVGATNFVNVYFSNCTFSGDISAAGASAFLVDTSIVDNVSFVDCNYLLDTGSLPIVDFQGAHKVRFSNCNFSACTFTGTSAGSPGGVLFFDSVVDASVSQCVFGDAGSSVLPVHVVHIEAATSGSCFISNNRFYRFHKGVATSGTVRSHVSDNFFGVVGSSGTALSVTAIELLGAGVSTIEQVALNNTIDMSSSVEHNSSFSWKGIDVSGDHVNAKIVKGNVINQIDLSHASSAATVYGIYYSVANENVVGVISNNHIRGISSAAASPTDVYGIYLETENASAGFSCVVSGNNITVNGISLACHCPSTTPRGRAIIDNNLLFSSWADSVVGYVAVLDAPGISFSNNHLVWFSGILAFAGSAGLLVSDSHIKVSGNFFGHNTTSSALGSGDCIKCESDNDLIEFVDISDNLFDTNPASNTGFYCVRLDESANASTTVIRNVKVNNNTFNLTEQNAAVYIRLTDVSSNIQVNDNIVYEDVFLATRSGIIISGIDDSNHAQNVSLSGNQIYGTMTSTDRTPNISVNPPTGIALVVRFCDYYKINDNVVKGWGGPSADGVSIYANNSDFGSITGNILQPGDDGITAGTINITGCTSGILMSNIVSGLGLGGSSRIIISGSAGIKPDGADGTTNLTVDDLNKVTTT